MDKIILIFFGVCGIFLIAFILWARKEGQKLKKKDHKKSKEQKMMEKIKRIR